MNQLRQLLSSLPSEIRDKAIENTKNYQCFPITTALTKSDALTLGFDWSLTPEGYEYWNDWHRKIVNEENLTPILF